MSSSGHEHSHEDSNQCPECKQKYLSSSESEAQSQQNQRIVIPIRKQLLNNGESELQSALAKLQSEVQLLKQSNITKDRMIEDLKKQMEHKITHYMIYGQINKQADEINKLKSEVGYGASAIHSRRDQFNQQKIKTIIRQETRRQNREERQIEKLPLRSSTSRKKFYSTLDNYGSLRKEISNSKRDSKAKQEKQNKKEEPAIQYFGDYKPIFNISEAKRKITQLQEILAKYEKERNWMMNFFRTFVKTMQNLAQDKYRQQIILADWSLKKKVKTSWRYLKHLLNFYLHDPASDQILV